MDAPTWRWRTTPRAPSACCSEMATGRSVLRGNGNGGFAPKTDFPAGQQPLSVAVDDLDRDGRLDLAVANNSSGTVSVLLGNGDGTFARAVRFASGNGPYSVAVGDLSDD